MPSRPTGRNQRERSVVFSADGLRLHGTLHLPAGEHPAVVIGCHGLLSTSDSPKQTELARRCNALGLAYLRFDHRGCGASQGRFEEVTTFEGRCNDLLAAIAWLRRDPQLGPGRGLFGSSLGGTVCLAVAARGGIDTVVTFAAPVRSSVLERKFAGEHPTLRAPEGLRFDLAACLPQIADLCIFHGENDTLVPLAHAREIYEAAGNPKKLIVQPGGDHRMSDADDQRRFIQKAADWLAQGIRGGNPGAALQAAARVASEE